MSGVTTGTRLERLVQLRRRIDQQIATEAVATAYGNRPTPILRVTAPPSPVCEPSPESLVTVPVNTLKPDAIRAWAEENGYGTHPRRIPRDVTLAYVEAHR